MQAFLLPVRERRVRSTRYLYFIDSRLGFSPPLVCHRQGVKFRGVRPNIRRSLLLPATYRNATMTTPTKKSHVSQSFRLSKCKILQWKILLLMLIFKSCCVAKVRHFHVVPRHFAPEDPEAPDDGIENRWGNKKLPQAPPSQIRKSLFP